MIKADIINECKAKKLPFPELIKRLSEIGIERYYVDLVKMEGTYYSGNGEALAMPLPIDNLPSLSENFNQQKVIDAIQNNQKGIIDYPAFIRNIIAAGTVSYTVYLDGKQVIYVGRKGDSHAENFHF